MRSHRADRILVEDMIGAVDRIVEYSTGMSKDDFLSDRKTIDAVVRNLEIIGEAASRLSDDLRKLRSEIEWQLLIGLRNRIVHEYFGVDAHIVWEILSRDLPVLRRDLQVVLSQLPPA